MCESFIIKGTIDRWSKKKVVVCSHIIGGKKGNPSGHTDQDWYLNLHNRYPHLHNRFCMFSFLFSSLFREDGDACSFGTRGLFR